MSNSGLYGSTGNVTVSSNNVTTLYNANPTNVKTGNVADRNFTTLYTVQAEIAPTRSYGNSNVEAFLNQGTDGANVVQNIQMSGNLNVGGQSNLGNVSNVHISGGNLNQILTTDGGGGLSWANVPDNRGNVVPYIHFDVTTTGTNQEFANTELTQYNNSNVNMNVMKNGVNIEPTQYSLSGNVLTILIPLNNGDTVDVLASSAGSNLTPGGNLNEVQYNGGSILNGNSTFTFDQGNTRLNVNNISVANISNLGDIGNVKITGGSNGYILTTDGSGNLNWETLPTSTSLNADISNVHISGGTGGYVLSTDGSGNLSWVTAFSGTATSLNANISNVHISGGSNGYALITNGSNVLSWSNTITHANVADLANSVAGANVSGVVANANYAAYAGNVVSANYANFAGTAFNVNGSNVGGYVADATHATVADSANSVAGANVTGTVSTASYAGTAGSATSAGYVTNADQPYIQTVGVLSSVVSNEYLEVIATPSISFGTLTVDFHNGNMIEITLNTNISSIVFTNVPSTYAYGFTFMVNITGSYTITWPSSILWVNNTPPTLTTTSGQVDVFEFYTVNGGSTYYGFVAGQNL